MRCAFPFHNGPSNGLFFSPSSSKKITYHGVREGKKEVRREKNVNTFLFFRLDRPASSKVTRINSRWWWWCGVALLLYNPLKREAAQTLYFYFFRRWVIIMFFFRPGGGNWSISQSRQINKSLLTLRTKHVRRSFSEKKIPFMLCVCNYGGAGRKKKLIAKGCCVASDLIN